MKKIIVASDLHGSGFYTKKLMAAAAREKAERMLLLGDRPYGAIATVKLIKWSLLSLSWRIMPS